MVEIETSLISLISLTGSGLFLLLLGAGSTSGLWPLDRFDSGQKCQHICKHKHKHVLHLPHARCEPTADLAPCVACRDCVLFTGNASSHKPCLSSSLPTHFSPLQWYSSGSCFARTSKVQLVSWSQWPPLTASVMAAPIPIAQEVPVDDCKVVSARPSGGDRKRE